MPDPIYLVTTLKEQRALAIDVLKPSFVMVFHSFHIDHFVSTFHIIFFPVINAVISYSPIKTFDIKKIYGVY